MYFIIMYFYCYYFCVLLLLYIVALARSRTARTRVALARSRTARMRMALASAERKQEHTLKKEHISPFINREIQRFDNTENKSSAQLGSLESKMFIAVKPTTFPFLLSLHVDAAQVRHNG